jgi:hypothetical protein
VDRDTHLRPGPESNQAPASDAAPDVEGEHESDAGSVVEGAVGSAVLKGPAAEPTGVDLSQLETEGSSAPDQGD